MRLVKLRSLKTTTKAGGFKEQEPFIRGPRRSRPCIVAHLPAQRSVEGARVVRAVRHRDVAKPLSRADTIFGTVYVGVLTPDELREGSHQHGSPHPREQQLVGVEALLDPDVRLRTGRPISRYAGDEGCAGSAGAEPHA